MKASSMVKPTAGNPVRPGGQHDHCCVEGIRRVLQHRPQDRLPVIRAPDIVIGKRPAKLRQKAEPCGWRAEVDQRTARRYHDCAALPSRCAGSAGEGRDISRLTAARMILL